MDTILRTDLPLKVFLRGKVRDMYDLGDSLLMIATDRISAFDCVLPNGIPYKGKVLTAFSVFWFDLMGDIIKNHLIASDIGKFPPELHGYSAILQGRSMLVKKTNRIDVECVVRGYLSGSAWDEYQRTSTVCGIPLPKGLKESEKLPEAIFTPAIKSDTGHDVNVTEKNVGELVGEDIKDEIKEKSIKIYEKAARNAERKGIIVADTKFEFGVYEDDIILIDEVLTPDSSRFWSLEEYSPGRAQRSFDKQFVRDYLKSIKWNKEPPAPSLPEEVIEKTSQRYIEAYNRITGMKL